MSNERYDTLKKTLCETITVLDREKHEAMKAVIAAAVALREHFAVSGHARLTIHDVSHILAINKALEALSEWTG